MSGTKKVFVTLGVVIVIAIAAMAIAPLFFDINKTIKPILISAIEKNLNAKVQMGEISLSLYGKVTFKVDTFKIVKDKITVDVSDLTMMMPYSVLTKNPTPWMQNIKMEVLADEISVNSRQLVVTYLKTDLLKQESVVKLKNTEFNVFDGKGKSYAQLEFTNGLKGLFEFEVKDGTWPVEKLKGALQNRVPNIPQAKKMISDIDIDDKFDSLKGNVTIENGITNIHNLSMTIPKDKVDINGSGTINTKNALKIDGNFILPLENVPGELRSSDGRGSIPFEILGSVDSPKVNWEKLIELVVHAYTKDEGKKIIKQEVNKLKEKLMKDEKIRDLIKGIKF